MRNRNFRYLFLWLAAPWVILAIIGVIDVAASTSTASGTVQTVAQQTPMPQYAPGDMYTPSDSLAKQTGNSSQMHNRSDDTANVLKLVFGLPLWIGLLLWIASNKRFYLKEPLVVA